jgi:hypothetical protein
VAREFPRRRQVREAIGEAEAVAHAVVVHGQYVRPAELEHQHHLHRPRSDATYLREPRDDRRIVEAIEDRAVGHHT